MDIFMNKYFSEMIYLRHLDHKNFGERILKHFLKNRVFAPKNKNRLLIVVQLAESNFAIYFL